MMEQKEQIRDRGVSRESLMNRIFRICEARKTEKKINVHIYACKQYSEYIQLEN